MTEQTAKRVNIPEGITVDIHAMVVRIQGPRGELIRDFTDPRFLRISINKTDNGVVITSQTSNRKLKAMTGTIAAHITNMINGVTKGYKYVMKIFYTHFPISVTLKDKEIHIKNFLGEKGARIAAIVGNAQVKIEKDEIIVTGNNIEEIGHTTANIERATKLNRKDRRIFNDGIYISGKFFQDGERL